MSNQNPRSDFFNTSNISGRARVTNVGGHHIQVRGDYIENHVCSEYTRLYPDFVVPDAAHNRRGFKAKCLAGTRRAVIAEFLRWKNDPAGHPVCWLSGSAGSGKSAVCQSIAELCEQHNCLGASFFFLRGAGRRSEFSHFITTLAFQLTLSVPATKSRIEDLLRRDPSMPYQSIEIQFEKLIVNPTIASAEQIPHTMLIFVDALDECNDRNSVQEFIGVLARSFTQYRLPLRFFLTSRAENHIRQSFAPGTIAQSMTLSLALEDYDAHGDIRAFFISRFQEIYTQNPRLMMDVGQPWPSTREIENLVKKSSGLFIFASTLVDFVTDGREPPQQKLRIVLQSHEGLDPLYTQVIEAVPDIECFPTVLATLMLLHEQPSINVLADLLELESEQVVHALMAIQSILKIPADNNTVIQLNHTSLRDFLTDERRSGRFYVDRPTIHVAITCGCVRIMARAFRKYIFPTKSAQTYACKNWHLHLKTMVEAGNVDSVSVELLTILKGFSTSQGMDVWINQSMLNGFDWTTLYALSSQLTSMSVDLARMLRHLSQTGKSNVVRAI